MFRRVAWSRGCCTISPKSVQTECANGGDHFTLARIEMYWDKHEEIDRMPAELGQKRPKIQHFLRKYRPLLVARIPAFAATCKTAKRRRKTTTTTATTDLRPSPITSWQVRRPRSSALTLPVNSPRATLRESSPSRDRHLPLPVHPRHRHRHRPPA